MEEVNNIHFKVIFQMLPVENEEDHQNLRIVELSSHPWFCAVRCDQQDLQKLLNCRIMWWRALCSFSKSLQGVDIHQMTCFCQVAHHLNRSLFSCHQHHCWVQIKLPSPQPQLQKKNCTPQRHNRVLNTLCNSNTKFQKLQDCKDVSLIAEGEVQGFGAKGIC